MKIVKRILAMLMACLFMVAVLAVMAAPAFAAPPAAKNQGKGQPVVNQGGKCPGGLNKDRSQGAQNKCDKL